MTRRRERRERIRRNRLRRAFRLPSGWVLHLPCRLRGGQTELHMVDQLSPRFSPRLWRVAYINRNRILYGTWYLL